MRNQLLLLALLAMQLPAADQRPTVVLIGAQAPSSTSVRVVSIPMPTGPLQLPPAGKAYRDNAEAHRLWRSIHLHSPDLVLIAGDPANLTAALATAGIAARRVSADKPLDALGPIGPAKPRPEDRSPDEVIRILEPHFGHEFREAVYIPAMALIARMRLGSLDDVRWIARPFVDGGQDSLAKPTASHLAGHLLFAELAENSGDQYWLHLARKAADLAETKPMDNEMSDSVFMACPILAKVGRLTGEAKYFDSAARHFRYMAKLDRRPDNLWRHSPLNEAAWGRGNAFPALGLALTLSDMPKAHPAHAELLASFRQHIEALAKHQDPETGMWHQVIDHPESYAEFSATAMIARAMIIGIRNGWLDPKQYTPRAQSAWRAIAARVSADGRVMDVCESTGKLKTLQEYLDREAIWARDARGGGMALIFAVEMKDFLRAR